jgi:hypothetical protein
MVWLWMVAHAAASPWCGTIEQLQRTRPMLHPLVTPSPPPPEGGALGSRDAVGVDHAWLESDHFVLRWGPDTSSTEADRQLTLDGLEQVWTTEIDDLGFPAPLGTESYRLNVYLGETGGNTPPIDFSGAYVTTDQEGFPIMVISPGLMDGLRYDPLSVPAVTAHEFMHMIQITIGAYSYEGDAAWYWEATANWIIQHVYPDWSGIGYGVGSYALLPHVALDHFDYPDAGTLIEGHHYGAEVFVSYLDTYHGGLPFVRATWLEATPNALPVEVFDTMLERGLDDAFADFSVRNATWDYPHGRAYAASADMMARYYPDEDARVAGWVPTAGTGGWQRPTRAFRPEALGYNLVVLDEPYKGTLDVAFDGNVEGDFGSPSSFWAHVVVEDKNGGVEVVPLLAGGTDGSAEIHTVLGDRVQLVVAATPEWSGYGEAFGYAYSFTWLDAEVPAEPPAPSEEAIDAGCGCSSGSGGVGSSLWLTAPFGMPARLRRR